MTVHSALPLPELDSTLSGTADWFLVRAPGGADHAWTAPFRHLTLPDGTVWLSLSRGDDRYVLRFPSLAVFSLVLLEHRIEVTPHDGVADHTVRHLFLDQVVPLLLVLEGAVVLHASAIATPGGVIAFVGPSGRGKSSLAASFVSGGYPLFSDDFVPLWQDSGQVTATPSYPGLRLWPDAVSAFDVQVESQPVTQYDDKRRVATRGRIETSVDPSPVRVLLLLGDEPPRNDVVSLWRPPAREAFVSLFQHAFRLERSGRDRQPVELERFARLVESVPVLRLEFRRDFAALAEVRAEILRTVDRQQ